VGVWVTYPKISYAEVAAPFLLFLTELQFSSAIL
jgi:hypothetical protein